MAPPVKIYGMMPSSPCRTLTMLCEVLGLDYELILVDRLAGEHLNPEFMKINPLHNIPVLKDGDFVTNESRAAAAYLVNKYGGSKKSQLYPEDPEKRAVQDQRMYFDMGTFYDAMAKIAFPVLMGSTKEVTEDKTARLKEVMGWVNDYVKKTGFAAGTDHLTLADICFLSTYTSLLFTEIADLSSYSDVTAWYERCKALIPNYEQANGQGAVAFGNVIKKAFQQ